MVAEESTSPRDPRVFSIRAHTSKHAPRWLERLDTNSGGWRSAEPQPRSVTKVITEAEAQWQFECRRRTVRNSIAKVRTGLGRWAG